ncbi:MAG: hypothetical protein HYV14_01355 [Elusimicrobia bacterium]|nr:hypothetical protein [Elusimicrobiota bacterium]
MKEFSAILRGLRLDAGHKTPRRFFLAQGGRAFFGCTYRNYANVEYGRSLPSPALMEKIAAALRLISDDARARPLLSAYLRALLEGTSLFDHILRALGRGPHSAADRWSPMRRALEENVRSRAFSLTRDQTDAVAGSIEGHWAFGVLIHDGGRWTAKRLAQVTGLRADRLRRVLERLTKLGLFERDSEGGYHCRHHGKDFHLAKGGMSQARLDALRRHFVESGEKHGGTKVSRFLCLRASERELQAYLPQIFEASFKELGLLSTDEKSEDTAFFHVEAVYRKILQF